jgi:hypothetical protein
MAPSQRPLPDNTNTHKRQTSMPPVGFEPTIPASARPQTPRLRARGHWDRPKQGNNDCKYLRSLLTITLRDLARCLPCLCGKGNEMCVLHNKQFGIKIITLHCFHDKTQTFQSCGSYTNCFRLHLFTTNSITRTHKCTLMWASLRGEPLIRRRCEISRTLRSR